MRLLFGEMEEYALIQAREVSYGTTLLQFWDGSPSLGLAFKEFSDVVVHPITWLANVLVLQPGEEGDQLRLVMDAKGGSLEK